MTKPKPPRVLEVDEGYYVAGTHDVDQAIDLLVDAEKIYTPYMDNLWKAPRGVPFSQDLPPGDRVEWRGRAHVGYANTGPIPGNPDDSDYTWMIYTHDGPGPGRYKLVWWN